MDTIGDNKMTKEKTMSKEDGIFKYPSQYSIDGKEKKLAQWIEAKKIAKRKGKLTKEQINKLEIMPGWKWQIGNW